MSDLTILPRSDWGARKPKGVRTRRDPSSIRKFVIHWPGGSPESWRHIDAKSEEAATLRAFQKFHQDTNGWVDIGYNLLMGNGGFGDDNVPRVWTARGCQFVPAAQANNNSGTLAMCVLLGPGDSVTDNIVSRIRSAIRWAEDYSGNRLQVVGHSHFGGTVCPGSDLTRLIRNGTFDIH